MTGRHGDAVIPRHGETETGPSQGEATGSSRQGDISSADCGMRIME